MSDHLLLTLPIPRPEFLLKRLQDAHPNLKITYLRHNVKPAEAFYKHEMEIDPAILRDATILMTMGAVPDPSDVPNLRYVHFSVAGIDHVAHKELLHQANMAVTTSTGAPAIAVAEWVFGTILGHFRQLFKFKEWQAAKVWGSLGPDTPTSTLDNKTMGIVGYGSIGRQVARVGRALGLKIVVYNSTARQSAAERKDPNFCQPGSGDPDGEIPSKYYHGRSREEFREFLSQDLDILVLSLPLTESTKHLVSSEELRALNAKKSAFLVNVARGPIVDQDALVASLVKGPANGGLLGAALDVTDPEPLPSDHELWGMPNVFISPHVSSITPQTMGRAFAILQENLKRRASGQELLNSTKTA